jgi:acetoin utilization protein AcuB
VKTAFVMTREVVVVSPPLSLAVAGQMMKRLAVRHLPVVDGGRLVGILSDRDVLRHADAAPTLTCGEAMTLAPRTARPEASVSQVAQLMLEHKIDSVPVVDASMRLIGLVTSSDLLQMLVERDQAQLLPFDFRLKVVDADGSLAASA